MVSPAICILHWIMSSTGAQTPIPYPQIMTAGTTLRQKRAAPETSSGINGLIAACNKNDRFKLLEDDSIQPGDLNNPIHPTLHWFDSQGSMRQMLQLASHFLSHDSLLAFFVPLLYGRESTGLLGDASKTYLSDPFEKASKEERGQYLEGVRRALHCLAHSVSFQFQPPASRIYARTVIDTTKRDHAASCCAAFQRKFSCRIEMAEYFQNYYSTGEYDAASRCAQFRHDFLFATTIVHEIVHAVGVLRRGNLSEPHIPADCPEAEWGYGWEHFMFGNIINPQDLTRSGTHLLMRKMWINQETAKEIGGKEYCDVPMSYIAQWFRNKTWDIITRHGPTAIAKPIANFKIQLSNKLGAWVVMSDHAEIKEDLKTLQSKWIDHVADATSRMASLPSPAARSRYPEIYWQLTTTRQLQRSKARVPLRPSARLQADTTREPKLTQYIQACHKPMKNLNETKRGSALGRRLHCSISCGTSRKRPAESLDECRRVGRSRKRQAVATLETEDKI
jgi:hypothetical protein